MDRVNQIFTKMGRAVALLMLTFIVAFAAFTAQALPGPTGFDKGAMFTVAGYAADKPSLTGFPVLVRIAANSPSGFSYDDLHSKSTGDDIAFVGMDGGGLPFEIDTWDPDGTSLIWVRLPTMANGTQFVMCWGSETSGKTVCGTNPWIDYTGVWHMGETGTPSDSNPVTIHDSTANGLDGSTKVGSFVSNGPFGGARRIATDRNNAHGIVVDATSGAKNDAANAMKADFHASCWVHAQGSDSTYGFLFDRRKGENGSGWGVRLSTDDKMQVYYGQGREARKETQANYSALYDTADGKWSKIDVLYKYQANDGQRQTVDIYLNGTYKESVDLSAEFVPLENANIGIGGSTQDNPSDNNKGRRFNGEMDEVRLGAFVPSADWIAADYATQSSPSFLAAGPAESYTGAPIVGLSVSDVGYTNATFTVDVLSLGAGAASATVTAQIAASTDFTAPLWTSSFTASGVDSRVMTAKGLPPGAVYWVRVVMSNGSVVMAETSPTSFATLAPIAVTGIGWTFSADGSTADFSFGISAVSNIAIGSAKLEYDGRTVSSQTFSSAGTLVWTGVPAAGRTATATVTVSADVGGTTYTHTWAVTVSPGSHAYAVSSLAEVSSLALRVGDTLTLPALARADDRYVAMDIRSFSLGEDGQTLKALEPGFSAVVSISRDGENAPYAIVGRALAVCIPEVAGSGRVFFARPGEKMNWEDASKWRNVTDPSAEADYPHLAGDVAMAALPDNQLILNGNATVAELYLGPDEDHLHTGGTQRLTGKSAATLTFARPSGKPGLLRFTGMLRIDTPAITNGFNRFAIGGGDGNSTSTGLGIEMPGGLEFDCGAWPDWTDTAVRNVFARARYWVSDSMRFWNIPEGRTLRISNTCGRHLGDDSQDGKANFCWESGGQVTGEGTFFYDAAASILSKGMFRTFRGVVKVANKQAYDTFAPNDRGGGFKFRPESYTSSSAQVAENATLLLEGDSSGSVGSSFGVVNAGHTHGYGSWGRAINAYPAKKWILDGGYVYQTHVGSTDVSWREDGTTNSPPVCIPNGAGTLCVSNGFNYVKLSQNSDEKIPTNSLVFAALEHTGDGVLLVRSDRLFNSFQNSGWRDRAVLGGFHDLAIGGTGRAVARHGGESVRTNYLESTAPIVPWIVAPVKADSSLYFPCADDDTDELVLAGATKSAVLDEVLDPTENIRVDGTTIAISADRTVNSLVLVSNRGIGRNLGAGRTLTITSGGLIIGNGNFYNMGVLGDETGYNAGTAGTVVFPNKAYIFVPTINDTKAYHPEIWARIVSPQGAVFSYPGDLHLGGDQTGIDDHIAVNGTDLRLGTETTGCQIDVPVHLHGAFARLRIGKQGSFCRQNLYFWDHATPGSKFIPAEGTEEVVNKLYVNGVNMPRGTYGATGSGAEFIDDNHFSGTGWVRVLKDDLAMPLIIRMK